MGIAYRGGGHTGYYRLVNAVAMSQATEDEVAKVSLVVEKLEATTSDNEVRTKLNEQAIQTIADGLAQQTEISKATDEKLGTLIELMLKERR